MATYVAIPKPDTKAKGRESYLVSGLWATAPQAANCLKIKVTEGWAQRGVKSEIPLTSLVK